MNEREKMVLHAIVNYYLTYGEMIGSRTLVKKYGIDFSSATIRNVMADLEDGGYLAKAHTSSGRIPTDLGYRYYLNELLKIEKLTKIEKEKIEVAYEQKINELDSILQQTSTLLSKLTNYAGLVIEPDHTREKIKKIELVHVDDNIVMAVIVMTNKAVRTKKIILDEPLTALEVQGLTQQINKKIAENNFDGSNFEDVINSKNKFYEIETVIKKEIYQDVEGKLFLENATGIIDTQGENVHKVMQLFESDNDIKRIFEEMVKDDDKPYGSVNVIFGDELNVDGLENYSFVYSRYKIGDADGVVGVIGPKRMAYSRTIGLVDYVTKEVNKVIEKIEEKG